ncbi:MAG: NUDIX domain-containing protein [Caulobacterales bacterium]|uniref:NUDIX domain-containing protein n=1 Tax=Glycocaulis sp. TaxID=1969725 RepID=UPI003F9FBBE8
MARTNPFDPTRHSEGNERPGVKPHPSVRKPALAASLILTRQRANGTTEILFGRRSGDHVFMPRKYVFPGGRVDRADGYAPLASEPAGPVREVLTRCMTERRARAAAAAAIRETAEETGLLIGESGTISRPRPAWQPFAAAGLAPAAAPLDLVARAITPPGRPRRFDAWFFRAPEEAVAARADAFTASELEDVRWVPLEETGSLDLPIITRFVLAELAGHMKGPAPVRCARVTPKGPRVDPL